MAEDIARSIVSNCPACSGRCALAESVSAACIVKPGVAYLSGLSHSELWALTCLQCGPATLYAKNPANLADKK